MMKKMLLVLLAAAMLLCAGSAMAHEGWTKLTLGNPEEKAYELASGNYYLSSNINLGENRLVIPDNAEVTLCLHGYKLSGQDGYITIRIETGGKLTLTNCEDTGMVSVTKGNRGIVIGVENNGTFSMTGSAQVSVSVSGSGDSNVIGVENNGTFSMTGSAQVSVSGSVKTYVHDGVRNHGTFSMTDSAQVTAYTSSSNVMGFAYGVSNYSTDSIDKDTVVTFTMHGGTVEGSDQGVNNHARNGRTATFTMHGGTVTGKKTQGVQNEVENGGTATFTMHGGTVTGEKQGVQNDVEGDGTATFTISAGKIYGGDPENTTERYGAVIGAQEESAIAAGSDKVDGGFAQEYVEVAKRPQTGDLPQTGSLPETGSLPQTGDPSMLMGWVCLLGASAAGLIMRRRRG